jgi:class 3 adenylate cyclase
MFFAPPKVVPAAYSSSQSTRKRVSAVSFDSKFTPQGASSGFRWLERIHNHAVWVSIVCVSSGLSVFVADFLHAMSEGSSADFNSDLFISFCVSIFFVDVNLLIVLKPGYLWNLHFLTDMLSIVALVFDLSLVIESIPENLVLLMITSGLRALRLIRLVRMCQESKPYMYILQRILGIHKVNDTHPSDGDIFRGASVNLRGLGVHNEEEEVGLHFIDESRNPGLSPLLRPSLSPAPKAMYTQRSREETRLRVQLADRNTLRVGLVIILCATVAPLLSSGDYAVDASSFKVSQLNALSLESGELCSRCILESFSELQSELSAVGWIRSTIAFDIRPIVDHVLNEFPESNSATNELTKGWTRTCGGENDVFWISFVPVCPLRPYRRGREVRIIESETRGPLVIILDQRELVRWAAILSMLKTAFLGILISFSSTFLEYDCAKILLAPISRILSILRQIGLDPICSINLTDQVQERASRLKARLDHWTSLPFWKRIFKRRPMSGQVDTELEKLEATVLKLGSLLCVGLGQAGSKAITSSISSHQRSSLGQPDGRTVNGVFGFIYIRHFSTVTQILRDNTLLLINRIAEIVHGIVDEHNGFICRNNTGSSGGFLIMWKLADSCEDSTTNSRIAELAIVCFSQIIAAVEKCPVLSMYRDHPHLKQVIPHNRIQLVTALHSGTAIEGTIQTEFKLDAAYLGDGVSFTSKLCELADTVYSTNLILSESVYMIISPEFRNRLCRKIDRIHTQNRTCGIFVVDLSPSDLRSHIRFDVTDRTRRMRQRSTWRLADEFIVKKAKEERQRAKLNPEKYDSLEVFSRNDLYLMRRRYENKQGKYYTSLFRKAFLNYLSGEWALSREALIKSFISQNETLRKEFTEKGTLTEQCMPRITSFSNLDGPSRAIFEYMLEFDKEHQRIAIPHIRSLSLSEAHLDD